MRIFPHFNPAGGAVCPICGTAHDKETVLIPTIKMDEGKTGETVQFHTECIENNWLYYPQQEMVMAPTQECDRAANAIRKLGRILPRNYSED